MTFSQKRSDAIRAGLISEVRGESKVRRRWAANIGMITAGALVGAGVSTAAFAANSSPDKVPPEEHAVAAEALARETLESAMEQERQRAEASLSTAPEGHVPGAPLITLVGGPTSIVVEDKATIALDHIPDEATHVRASLTCIDGGRYSWGPNANGNNGSIGCSAGDGGYDDFALEETDGNLYFVAKSGKSASITLQYLNYVETAFGVNENGQTYGSYASGSARPDLTAVIYGNADGEHSIGYVRTVDLEAFSPDHPDQPSNPDEAIEWQAEIEEKYPNGWDIPVFEPDGVTQIGTFRTG